ncbi:Uncharacterised protein at_DN0030 [Pycnogonum litorale]
MAVTNAPLKQNVKYLYALAILLANFFFGNTLYAQRQIQDDLKFTEEPPSRISFFNSVAVTIRCSATSPGETSSHNVSWTLDNGRLLRNISSIRYNIEGSLEFKSFKPSQYLHDVHSAVYRCKASDAHGTITSRPVQVKAVIRQPYQTMVYDEFVIHGNTGVLKCQLPAYVNDDVIVSGWVRNDNMLIKESTNYKQDKYTVFPDGYLHIHEVTPADGHFSYWCRTRHRLDDKEIFQLSETSGKLQVTGHTGNSLPPRISHILNTVVIFSGQKVMLPCAGQGYPVPDYIWQKEASKLKKLPYAKTSHLKSGSLIIESTKANDSGRYSCKIYNNVGSDTKTTELIIREPLAVVLVPKKQRVSAGDSLMLNCSGYGSPIRSIDWYKDGKKIDLNEKNIHERRHSSRSILKLLTVTRRDGGIYQCFVFNKWEAAQASSTVTLENILPEIVNGFESDTLQPGPDVRLTCSARGTPNPQIFWRLDNVENMNTSKRVTVKETVRNGLVSSDLVINGIRTEDGGIYTCIANNKKGTANHSARINVYGLQSVRPMGNIKVTSGQDVNVTCYASGYPIREIYWIAGGNKIPGSILNLKSVQKKHAKNEYACVAIGSGGKRSKQQLRLTVSEKPEVGIVFPKGVRNGMEISAFCTVTRGDKPVELFWLKDGQPIKYYTGIITTKSSDYVKLQINSISKHHSGNYTCVATNAAGKVQKSKILTVKGSPVWVKLPENVTALEGNEIYIHCSAEGEPTPSANWKKISGYGLLEVKNLDGRLVVFRNGTLKIKRAKESDTGWYQCTITNGIQPDLSQKMHLHIGSLPIISNLEERLHLAVGEVLKIKCKSTGNDDTHVEWFRNDDVISDDRFVIGERKTENGHEFTLQLDHALSSDSAVYGCLAFNKFGESSSKVYVNIREPTKFTSGKGKYASAVTTVKPLMQGTTTTRQRNIENITTKDYNQAVTVPATQSTTPETEENQQNPSNNGWFRWKKYMLYYVIPAGVVIIVLVVALTVVLCLLCCSRNNRQKARPRYESQQKIDNKLQSSKISEYDTPLTDVRYGKVGGCHGRRPLSGSFPNLPANDNHYLGFSPYGTLEPKSSNYHPRQC